MVTNCKKFPKQAKRNTGVHFTALVSLMQILLLNEAS